MGIKRTVEPATSPVTTTEAKTHLRVTTSDHDTRIAQLILAATSIIENKAGASIIAQTWKLTLDKFSDAIELPRGPVQSVASVQYYDAAGTLQTVSAADYTLDDQSAPQCIVRNQNATWPATQDRINAVEITYVAGFATLPDDIKHAVLLLVGHWFHDAEGKDFPHVVDLLIANYRAGWVGA